MQIRTLKLQNFRGFAADHSFDFAERFTVFAGVNGKGKTTVLDALAFILSRLLPQISEAGRSLTVGKDDIHGKSASLRVEVKTNCAGIPLDFWVSYKTGKRVKGRKLPSAVKSAVSMTER